MFAFYSDLSDNKIVTLSYQVFNILFNMKQV